MIPDTEVTGSCLRDVQLAGYRECVKRAVITLLKDQHLSSSDLQVQMMSAHLRMRQAHHEYQRLMDIADDHQMNTELSKKLVALAYQGCDFNYS